LHRVEIRQLEKMFQQYLHLVLTIIFMKYLSMLENLRDIFFRMKGDRLLSGLSQINVRIQQQCKFYEPSAKMKEFVIIHQFNYAIKT
jgi:hypothetical protein